MAGAKADQSQTQVKWVAGVLLAGFYLALPMWALTLPVSNDPTNSAIFPTALATILLWCLGWPLLLATRATIPTWRESLPSRAIWTLGCVLLLLHIAVAFHLGHDWSHKTAWERTQQVAGYGDGIYVNYAFALVWLADVLWAWIAFDSYLTRPQWVRWTILGFLAFIVFNAAVVFGTWTTRVVSLVIFLPVFLLVAVEAWYKHRRAAQSAVTVPPSESNEVPKSDLPSSQ